MTRTILLVLGKLKYRKKQAPNGSHHRVKHPDGRVTTVPVHKNEDLPKGLVRKIIREDLEMNFDEFVVFVRENG
ncbi:MAG TPA: hypothetical protein DCR35_19065 [Runella sp.]|nr:hypothetical protein [Runella sp.]HAO51218.1 hypothetical protein [Runella sp.]